jgi:hypothetical protein
VLLRSLRWRSWSSRSLSMSHCHVRLSHRIRSKLRSSRWTNGGYRGGRSKLPDPTRRVNPKGTGDREHVTRRRESPSPSRAVTPSQRRRESHGKKR